MAAIVNQQSVKLAFSQPCIEDTMADRQCIISCTVQQRASNGGTATILVMSGPGSAWSRASGSPCCALPIPCCQNRAALLYGARGKTRPAAASQRKTETIVSPSFMTTLMCFTCSVFPSSLIALMCPTCVSVYLNPFGLPYHCQVIVLCTTLY